MSEWPEWSRYRLYFASVCGLLFVLLFLLWATLRQLARGLGLL